MCDLAGDCDTATVDITVNNVNEPPTAANDMDSVNEDSSVTVDVLGNDSGVDDALDPSICDGDRCSGATGRRR